jgi:hypothetical protein
LIAASEGEQYVIRNTYCGKGTRTVQTVYPVNYIQT